MLRHRKSLCFSLLLLAACLYSSTAQAIPLPFSCRDLSAVIRPGGAGAPFAEASGCPGPLRAEFGRDVVFSIDLVLDEGVIQHQHDFIRQHQGNPQTFSSTAVITFTAPSAESSLGITPATENAGLSPWNVLVTIEDNTAQTSFHFFAGTILRPSDEFFAAGPALEPLLFPLVAGHDYTLGSRVVLGSTNDGSQTLQHTLLLSLVPEPDGVWLMGVGFVSLAVMRGRARALRRSSSVH